MPERLVDQWLVHALALQKGALGPHARFYVI